MKKFTSFFSHLREIPRKDLLRFLILRTVGNFLFLVAIFGVTVTFGGALYVEVEYRINALRGVEYVLAEQEEVSHFLPSEEVIVAIRPVNTEFSIVIPKINANAPIVSNVNPTQYEDYMEALKKGVAHSAGSVFPGMEGNVYLFAHSTDFAWNINRYNAVFYLLKEIKPGDEIDIFFLGRRYVYMVVDTKIVSPDEVGYLEGNLSGKPRLTLQTCWPPGTTLRRLLVFAEPKINSLSNSARGKENMPLGL